MEGLDFPLFSMICFISIRKRIIQWQIYSVFIFNVKVAKEFSVV